MQIKIKLIENLDRIIAQSVKPLQAIDSIKILQADGLTGPANDSAAVVQAGGGNLADNVLNSLWISFWPKSDSTAPALRG